MTKDEIMQIRIEEPTREMYDAVKQVWDEIGKPLDSLGCFEDMICRIGAIRGTTEVRVTKRAVITMCADNGIVAEGVSQSGQEVTAIVAANMARGISSVCRMAHLAGADVIPVDIGIATEICEPNLRNRKVAMGTRNFLQEPAMTEGECARAIGVGIEMVKTCSGKGYELLATGEMGIGNTTTSSAVAAALLQRVPHEIAGRGAGLSDRGLRRKYQVIGEAIEKYDLYHADPFTILKTVGGLDIAGLTGVFIGGALCHIPVIIDGVISAVSALLAERLVPGCRKYMLASHVSREPAAAQILELLELTPVIHANLALGEGTGAVMLMPLLDMALSVYQSHTTFEDIRVEQYQRFEEV
ncbi:MAG: nicotinate-nucleotide--dimethylbenzimidazole phosphoribosyltransferase [Roseburia sp.]